MGRQIRRGTYIWLGLLGVAVGIITLAGLGSGSFGQAILALLLAAVYVGVAGFTLANRSLQDLRQNIKMPPIRVGVRVSSTARRAMGRAYKQAMFTPDNILTDVGLIFNKRLRDGSWERELVTEDRSVMISDAAVQPFAKVNVLPMHSDRVGVITFEIFDQAGRLRFTRQTEQILRPGDNTVVCDRQLVLQHGDPVTRSGTWDLKISLNGDLIGIHSFGVKPSTDQRRRNFNADAESAIENLKLPEEGPVSLDDLLSQQKSDSAGRRR